MRLQAAVGCETERKAPTLPTLLPGSRIRVDAPMPPGLILTPHSASCSLLEPPSCSVLATPYPMGSF